MFVLFLLQVAFEDPEVQGIYLLTDGKPVSLHFMSCPPLKCFAKKSNWEINCWLFMQMCSCQCLFSYSKTANKKRAACFPSLLQNQLNSDVARFTTDARTCRKVARWWNVQHRYSTRFASMLQNKLHVFCCPLTVALASSATFLYRHSAFLSNLCKFFTC